MCSMRSKSCGVRLCEFLGFLGLTSDLCDDVSSSINVTQSSHSSTFYKPHKYVRLPSIIWLSAIGDMLLLIFALDCASEMKLCRKQPNKEKTKMPIPSDFDQHICVFSLPFFHVRSIVADINTCAERRSNK